MINQHKDTSFQKFENFFYGVIIFSSVILGFETNEYIRERYSILILMFDILIVSIFVFEIILRIEHEHNNKRNYFTLHNGNINKVNLLDFIIVVLNVIPFVIYFIEGNIHPTLFLKFFLIFRILRLTRLVELISHFDSLKKIITVLKNSVQHILNIIYFLIILFYIYAVLGDILFSNYDTNHFGNLGLSLLTLFESIAGGWTSIMEELLNRTDYGHFSQTEIFIIVPVYFVSFYIFVFSIIFNIFTGLIVSEVDELKINSKTNPSVRNAMALEEIKNSIEEIKTELKRLNK